MTRRGVKRPAVRVRREFSDTPYAGLPKGQSFFMFRQRSQTIFGVFTNISILAY